MNRRFFLCGAIAAPIVAGAPLARFLQPRPLHTLRQFSIDVRMTPQEPFGHLTPDAIRTAVGAFRVVMLGSGNDLAPSDVVLERPCGAVDVRWVNVPGIGDMRAIPYYDGKMDEARFRFDVQVRDYGPQAEPLRAYLERQWWEAA